MKSGTKNLESRMILRHKIVVVVYWLQSQEEIIAFIAAC